MFGWGNQEFVPFKFIAVKFNQAIKQQLLINYPKIDSKTLFKSKPFEFKFASEIEWRLNQFLSRKSIRIEYLFFMNI